MPVGTTPVGKPPASTIACRNARRSDTRGRGTSCKGSIARPLAGRLPVGKGSRCLRRGDGGGGAVRPERGGDSETHDAMEGDHIA
ncbi:hypothetical protein B296_00048206 [Ensete ventricosum]|uniref:Uncharacterized protein n=1 Tax=Ensete ventricosum TaxID=4639 RepID=A0A426XAC3_ENSVE|nr:hypothetical protein B296_00048206 [Ensete ventricosum]